ncbi:MAG: hypothetical protein EOP93_18980, partial [Lysobacteraceae bacterium]
MRAHLQMLGHQVLRRQQEVDGLQRRAVGVDLVDVEGAARLQVVVIGADQPQQPVGMVRRALTHDEALARGGEGRPGSLAVAHGAVDDAQLHEARGRRRARRGDEGVQQVVLFQHEVDHQPEAAHQVGVIAVAGDALVEVVVGLHGRGLHAGEAGAAHGLLCGGRHAAVVEAVALPQRV